MDQLWFRARLPLPIELWTGWTDLVYSPDFTAPPSLRRPSIVTVHDLAFEIVPERAPAALRNYLSAVVPRQVRRAAAVVAVSETTRRDLVERMNVDPDIVTVIPNAADERFFTSQPLSDVDRARLNLPERYFLTVGTLEPRKNHLTLFEAVRRLPGTTEVPLVVVGRVGWHADEIVRQAAELQRQGRAIVLDYVDDRLLPGLYAGAAAVVYPSWYEGFGLPVLEGLAAGVAVIASDVPAHREIAGNAAVLVDPKDVDALAGAMETVLLGNANTEETAAARRARAARYAWQTSGRRLADLLRRTATT